MNARTPSYAPIVVTAAVLAVVSLTSPPSARAHCDRMDGPVAKAALDALESASFETVQIWVGEAQEAELRRAYERALAARSEGPRARDLADRYFVESAVRLHRQAEGMAYTGVKPAGLELPPDVEAADRAIETGDPEPLLDLLTDATRQHVRRRFQQAVDERAGRHAGVKAGRAWVDAYVKYIVYVHGLYETIEAGPAHGVGHPR